MSFGKNSLFGKGQARQMVNKRLPRTTILKLHCVPLFKNSNIRGDSY